jgi:hypothetical protein
VPRLEGFWSFLVGRKRNHQGEDDVTQCGVDLVKGGLLKIVWCDQPAASFFLKWSGKLRESDIDFRRCCRNSRELLLNLKRI